MMVVILSLLLLVVEMSEVTISLSEDVEEEMEIVDEATSLIASTTPRSRFYPV